MASRLLLSRAAAIALRALVELAREPGATLSVAELARRQQLPQPMLEQILLRLRRAALVEARRGRHGGYRLAHNAETLPLARVLQAVERPRPQGQVQSGADRRVRWPQDSGDAAGPAVASPTAVSAAGLPERCSWLVATASAASAWPEPEAGALPLAPQPPGEAGQRGEAEDGPDSLGASAGHRVEQQLRQRLERLLQRELQRLTLAELLYDQRSWEASLGPEGGVMLS